MLRERNGVRYAQEEVGVRACCYRGRVAVLCPNYFETEPLVLAPYEIAYVQGSSCPADKVLKVTGAIRGLDRKRVCVVLDSVQTSLVTGAPQGILAGAGADHLGDVIDHEATRY